MKRTLLWTGAVGLLLTLLALDADAQRRGGGGGGRGGGGGARVGGGGGGFGGGAPRGGAVAGGFGGGGAPRAGGTGGFSGSKTPVVGPGGGTGSVNRGGGSYTTKGGTTISGKGGAIGGTTPGGVSGGKYVGGINVQGPGGRDVTKVGSGGAVGGPGGNVVGGKQGTTVGSGPGGNFASKYQGGFAIGPQGGVAGKAGVAAGPGGVAAGRGGVAAGPYGGVAGKTGVVAGRGGTYYRSGAALRTQGGYVRAGVANYNCFRPGWYTQHPGAWFAAGWAAGYVWRAATWPSCSAYCGIVAEPIYYDYGQTIVYQDDGVYVDGSLAGSIDAYSQQAVDLAQAGADAKTTKEEEWLPLGVFAMVQGEEKIANYIFQLAVNKEGIIRGNYYDAVTDSTLPVSGKVDKKTQRAAWTVGDRKTTVYEVGFANLTKDETTMVVHYGTERTQQFTFIRIENPETEKKE
jgi:hypothetical protein